jgi:hypothetical protein
MELSLASSILQAELPETVVVVCGQHRARCAILGRRRLISSLGRYLAVGEAAPAAASGRAGRQPPPLTPRRAAAAQN